MNSADDLEHQLHLDLAEAQDIDEQERIVDNIDSLLKNEDSKGVQVISSRKDGHGFRLSFLIPEISMVRLYYRLTSIACHTAIPNILIKATVLSRIAKILERIML
jgi:hypothetical protein